MLAAKPAVLTAEDFARLESTLEQAVFDLCDSVVSEPEEMTARHEIYQRIDRGECLDGLQRVFVLCEAACRETSKPPAALEWLKRLVSDIYDLERMRQYQPGLPTGKPLHVTHRSGTRGLG